MIHNVDNIKMVIDELDQIILLGFEWTRQYVLGVNENELHSLSPACLQPLMEMHIGTPAVNHRKRPRVFSIAKYFILLQL